MFPDTLVRDFANNKGSVFIGAGISRAAGLPDWTTFVAGLAEKLPPYPSTASYLDVAQYYANEHTRRELVERLRSELQASTQSPTPMHDEIVRLPVQRIFTTNLDTLLEYAAIRAKRTYRRFVNEDKVVSADPNQLTLFKLHGDVEQPESYVITADDYEGYAAKYQTSVLLMSHELHTRTVLFLGYSFNDMDLRMILRQVTAQSGPLRRRHFSVQCNPLPCVVKDLDRREVQVIPLKSGSTSDEMSEAVLEWLRTFAEKVRSFDEKLQSPLKTTGPAVSASAPSISFNPRVPTYSKFLGRETELDRVIENLSAPNCAVVIIEGFPGIGKTSLATEAATRMVAQRNSGTQQRTTLFDYEVWITIDKPDQKLWLDEVLNAVSLAVSGQSAAKDMEASKRDVHRLLDSHRVLIIIDNFETVDDPALASWLDAMPRPSRALITTRQFTASRFHRACRLELQGLSEQTARLFVSAQAKAMGVESSLSGRESEVDNLIEVTGRNPQALLLALGLAMRGTVTLGQVAVQLGTATPTDALDEGLFQKLFSWSWTLASEAARQIVFSTPLFSGLTSIRQDALQSVTGLDATDFDRALEQVLDLKLLSRNTDGRLWIHPLTRSFARKRLEERSTDERAALKTRHLMHYLEFVRKNVVRPKPEPPYWNALVSKGMVNLDAEWPAIQEAMVWAKNSGRSRNLVELVMMLVHYLDSRFLNEERVAWVKEAIAALKADGEKKEEALLRIDALGWTYSEEGLLTEAYEEICRGFDIAKRLEGNDRSDLLALGYGWRARVRIEQGQREEAAILIQSALAINSSPWIWYRVNMAAGDIAMKEGDCKRALQFFQSAANQVEEYGGEEGYQIETRLGLAWAGVGNLDEAEKDFKRISGLDQIAIGKLHAQYGLALIAHLRGDKETARQLAEAVRESLTTRTKSGLLLKMVVDLFQTVCASEAK